jgi:hypothetical protein
MELTRYKIAVILFAAVVAWGAAVSLAEFNHRVRPETPIYAFKLEDHGAGLYQVEFLGERVDLALPGDQIMKYADSEKIMGYREQAAAKFENSNRYFKAFLTETLIKLNEKKEVLREDLIFYASSWENLIPLEK